ncbi:MAG TPA: nucleoside/nucleotide kinase family protein [Actinomycetes bacterium]|nr:nucleoside/nucleotide kinase family protein [Actinomycetes bacterium]
MRDDLVARAVGLCADRRALLGLVGCPGAGKTTVAEHLVAAARAALGDDAVAHVPMDGYHLADRQLDRLGLRDRKGAPETFDVDGYLALLRRLVDPAEERTVYAPVFERDLEQPLAGAVAVEPAVRLVVTEGNYLLLDRPGWRDLATVLDETWFVDVDDDDRVRRLVARHELYGKPHDAAVAWVASVDEPNAELVRSTRDRADLVVPG